MSYDEDMSTAETGLPDIDNSHTARAEWCEPLWVRYRAFSHELLPERANK